MRRKSTRNVKKSPEKTKPETPKNSRRQSRRRRRSTSGSADDSENELEQNIDDSKSVRSECDTDTDCKNASDAESIPDSKSKRENNGTKRPRRGRTRVSPIKEELVNEAEGSDDEQEEKKGKGKSKSKNKTKIDKSSNIEPETQMNSEISENVQVTPQSPSNDNPVDNENVDESKIHVQSVDQTEQQEQSECDAQYSNCESRSEDVSELQKHLTEHCDQQLNYKSQVEPVEENSNCTEHCEQETPQSPKELSAPNEISVSKSTVEESQKEIVENSGDQMEVAGWSSTYEKQNSLQEPKENHESIDSSPPKEIENSVNNEKTPIKKVPEKEEVRTRKSSEVQEGTNEEKIVKSAKKVKLIRKSFNEQTSTEDDKEVSIETPNRRRHKWGSTDYRLKKVEVFKVDVESLKEVCPNLEFLNENEVKLEPVRRDSLISNDGEKIEKNDRRESTDVKSEDSDKSTVEPENEEPVVDKNIIAMNRKISIVDDTASKLRPPPSPAKNPVSEVLFINNLVRPFTLKALKELLERTGKIKEENGFWTDKIKSKCIVEYETKEEAEATRNALHGVHWPIGNGKKLMIEYSTKEDLDKALNPPPPPVPVVPEKLEKENKEPIKSADGHKSLRDRERDLEKDEKRRRSGDHVREWDLGKEERRGRSKSRERVRRHSKRSPSPNDDYINRKQRKIDEPVPQKLMDDLFLKTKATPSIYWQPLSPEEIQMKQQQRLICMEEHKRRMEQNTRPPMGRDRGRGGAPYRRRYD